MSVYSGPEINESGLVLSIDMGNTAKSFLGANTTNYYWIPTPDSTGNVAFAVNGTGTFKRITSGNYGGYDIKSSDVVYRLDFTTTNGCYYHGNDNFTGFSAGDVVTFSFDYYISPTSTGYPSINYLANIEIYDTNPAGWVGIGGAGTSDPTPSVIGVWKTATITVTVPSFTYGVTVRPSLYPGACNPSRLADTGFILYKNPQLEKRSFRTPFVANTRSNTQSVIDITGLNTVTANSLTFNSDNTYSFNGTNNFLSTNGFSYNPNSTGFTFEAIIKPTTSNASLSTYRRLLVLETSGATFYGILLEPDSRGIRTDVPGSTGTRYGVNTNYTLTGGTTYHLVWTWYNWTNNLYINGSLVLGPTSDGGTGTAASMGSFNIGGTTTNNYFPGTVYKTNLYNRVLTAEEVKRSFNANRGRFGL